MTEETRRKKQERLEELNQRCIKCKQKEKPSLERCNYYCTIGRKIHMLDAELGNGWGKHNYWK